MHLLGVLYNTVCIVRGKDAFTWCAVQHCMHSQRQGCIYLVCCTTHIVRGKDAFTWCAVQHHSPRQGCIYLVCCTTLYA